MGILGSLFHKKPGRTDDASGRREKVRGEYFDVILEEESLRERVAAVCSMDILEYYLPLSDCDGGYIYSMDGKAFAGDGGGGYYVLLSGGGVGYINFGENECGKVAGSVRELLELELNCAYSWHNYLDKKYLEDPSLLNEIVASWEREGQEQFEDAYGEDLPGYEELRRELAEKLNVNLSPDITKDVLPKLYQTVVEQPEFTAKSKTDGTFLGKLYR